MLVDQILVPTDLLFCQETPGVVLQAAIIQLPPVPKGRLVNDHLVLIVKPPLLFEDPVQTVLRCLCCRIVPASCCSGEVGFATFHLETEALAKVLEEADLADLKNTVKEMIMRSNQHGEISI